MKKRDWIFPAITAAVLITDQVVKHKARRELSEGSSRPFRHCHALRFWNSHNSGAAMNLGEQHPAFVRGVAAGYTLVLTIVYVLTLGFSGSTLLKTGLSFFLGGAYSNTYDRLRQHYVTDYISFDFGPKFLRKIVYNFGDFAIALGAFLSVAGIGAQDAD